MSLILSECEFMLIASETAVMNRYFKERLVRRRVVSRTTKNVLLHELEVFVEDMEDYYKPTGVSGLVTNPKVIQTLIDNVMLDMMVKGLQNYSDYVKQTIEEWETERISLNKFISKLDSFASNGIDNMINNTIRS